MNDYASGSEVQIAYVENLLVATLNVSLNGAVLSVTTSIRVKGTESFYQPLKECIDQPGSHIVSWDEFRTPEFMGNYAYETIYEIPIVARHDRCSVPSWMTSAMMLRHPFPYQRDRGEIPMQSDVVEQTNETARIGRWGGDE